MTLQTNTATLDDGRATAWAADLQASLAPFWAGGGSDLLLSVPDREEAGGGPGPHPRGGPDGADGRAPGRPVPLGGGGGSRPLRRAGRPLRPGRSRRPRPAGGAARPPP